ncbi:MAG: 50S ribosomal protein L23 [Candidatus ainarchaeum sp.]|jgi:ribosomal protein L23|nr:50S ribosomal protein L23 [Candidatus ainarchaeum sp.]
MVLIAPVKTEKAIGRIEFENTITFLVEQGSTKPAVKAEVEKLFGVKVASVRMLNLPTGGKRAIVKLAEGSKAEDISSKLKMV